MMNTNLPDKGKKIKIILTSLPTVLPPRYFY